MTEKRLLPTGSGRSQMRVGAGDDAKVVWIHIETLLQREASGECRANKTRVRLWWIVKTRYVVLRQAFEGTKFIARHPRFEVAFRGALVLHNFHKRFIARSQPRILHTHGRAIVFQLVEHVARAHVGIMGNHQRLTRVV